MARLRINRPLWLDDLPASLIPHYPPLRGDCAVDVVIVGGGVTGATVALDLTLAGIRVAVLEERKIGRGSTAASTALLMQEPDEDLTSLAGRYGLSDARQVWQMSRQATRRFTETIRRLPTDCDLQSRDSVYYSIDSHAALRREHRRRRGAGFGGRWLDAKAVQRVANVTGAVAIRTTGNAQVDPYKVCVGLTAAAVRGGAEVFEHTPVRRSRTERDGVTVTTPRGRVHAEWMVVATGYATPEFKRLRARFRLKHTYVVVTAPMSAPARRRVGLAPVMLWDTDRPYHYARWTPDGRLMMGGADRPHTNGRARWRALRDGTAAVRAHFEHLYPALAGVDVDYAWEGLFATTPDGLPYVGRHRHFPRHLFALGYGGNGMTFAALAAGLIRDELLGRPNDGHRLFAFSRMRRKCHATERIGNSS